MKPSLKVVLFFAALIVICCAVSLSMVRLFPHPGTSSKTLGHEWLHEQLRLTDAEDAALDLIEESYAGRQNQLKTEFNARKAKLSSILANSETYTDEVTAAIVEIHKSHGELQRLSIEHYFNMMEVLSPENQLKLKSIASEALSQPK